ncbi:hypothetical protein FH972_008588 [Carpinus fangiana]|uniref:Uncharacterized protein n=1 Tax=Carpinus fangiana TaxID=176857 RepID=A0A5N6QZ82_9ROSI|nr:hypothetical protein FH972_008588 [Carpinus fangiana]
MTRKLRRTCSPKAMIRDFVRRLLETLVCFRSQEKERKSKTTEVEVAEPSCNNAATEVEVEVEEKEIHVDTEEKRDEQPDYCNDNDGDETPTHQVPQPSNEAAVLQQDMLADQAYEVSYSIYPSSSSSSLPDQPPPAYYNPSMSENPPYLPYDARCCPNRQSDSSFDNWVDQLYEWFFGVQFYYH